MLEDAKEVLVVLDLFVNVRSREKIEMILLLPENQPPNQFLAALDDVLRYAFLVVLSRVLRHLVCVDAHA